MSEQTERERLVEELTKIAKGNIVVLIDKAVEFILAERKRIVAPILEYKRQHSEENSDHWGDFEQDQLIDQTLKLAGVDL